MDHLDAPRTVTAILGKGAMAAVFATGRHQAEPALMSADDKFGLAFGVRLGQG